MPKFRVTRSISALFCATVLAAGVAAVPAGMAAQQPYHIIDSWKIGGDGFWDYLNVDQVTHRLYVAHNTQVQVVDTTTGKQVGAIDGLKGCHGITFDANGKYGYISDGRGNAVVVFDRASLAKVASIEVTDSPDGIIFEPATQTVWTFNGRSTATGIDVASRKIIVTIKLAGRAEAPAIDRKGNVYGNVEGKIIRIDAHTKAINATWPTGCEDASGLAVDVDGHRLFQACDGKKMSVVDSESGKVLGHTAIGDDPDSAGFSAKYKLAFASTKDGILSVVGSSDKGYTTIEKLTTQEGARTMTYDPSTDRVYTVSATETKSPSAANQLVPPPSGPGGPGGPGGPNGGRPPVPPSFVPGSFSVIVIGR